MISLSQEGEFFKFLRQEPTASAIPLPLLDAENDYK